MEYEELDNEKQNTKAVGLKFKISKYTRPFIKLTYILI